MCNRSDNSAGYGTKRDHRTGAVLAYVLAPHEDAAFKQLQQLLAPFSIERFYTDSWGAYLRLLDSQKHTIGKTNTQRIERQHLMLRTRIKRLARAYDLLLQIHLAARYCDWLVHQPLRVWSGSMIVRPQV